LKYFTNILCSLKIKYFELYIVAARVAHCLGLVGPNVSTESGCSTSSVAVGMAVKSLRKGEVLE
jgi:acyl transferase domain-containing protein